jgi:hypothetical protein
MLARTLIGLTAALLATTAPGAHATDPPVPGAFKGLRPHQVVEQLMAQREALGLTEQQFARLDELSLAVRNEKHWYAHQGGKPHRTRHVQMISRGEAFARAMAVLTAEQQAQMKFLFPEPVVRATRRPTVPRGKP